MMEPTWMMLLDSAIDFIMIIAVVFISWQLYKAVKRQTRIADKLEVVLEVLNSSESEN